MEHHGSHTEHSADPTHHDMVENNTTMMSHVQGGHDDMNHHSGDHVTPPGHGDHGHLMMDDNSSHVEDGAMGKHPGHSGHSMMDNSSNVHHHHMDHDDHSEHFDHLALLLNFGNSSSPSPCGDTVYCIFEQVIVVTLPILIIISNAITISVLLKTKSLRNCHGYYLLSLAIADLLMGPVSLAAIYPAFYSYWPFGIVTCFTTAYIGEVCMKVSLLMLVWLSVERFVAIYYPFKYHQFFSSRNTILSILASWVLCNLVYMLTIPTEVICFSYESDKYMCTVTYFLHPEYVIAILLAFLVPSFVIVTVTNAMSCYSIFRRQAGFQKQLRQQGTGGARKASKSRVQRDKNRRAFQVLITMLVSFYICWLPYIGLHIYAYSNGNRWNLNHSLEFYSYWLAVSNSCVNPMIYFGMNRAFKEATKILLKRMVSCCTRGKVFSDTPGGSGSNVESATIDKCSAAVVSKTHTPCDDGVNNPGYEQESS